MYEFYNHLPKDFDFFEGEPLSKEIWQNKYRWKDEANFADTAKRVAYGVYPATTETTHVVDAYNAMRKGLWMPGGRILAGAGTDKFVTLMNCYVNGTVNDSMRGIHDAFGNIMFTMQQGGGIGTDWSPLRPSGAWLGRTQAPASGPCPFISSADAIGLTVESAGERRGAQMWTIADSHPDLPEFIVKKHEKGIWTNGNISILISDAFMGAIAEDEDWLLYHKCKPRERDPKLESLDFDDDNGIRMYVYSVWKARELWELITRSTYEYSEPGVIFIDRVNDWNNLQYCEEIRCTNPCGEQPLPPHGTCNLGAVNLALMVRKPFTDDAEFDWDLLRNTVRVGTRFLDNVIEATNYPLAEQKAEELAKRRIGLGFSGLASAFAQLGVRYGSAKSARLAGDITQAICLQAYQTSCDLAEELGHFPLYDAKEFWDGEGFAARKLKEQPFFGRPIRNGVLLTIAPTGTTSVAYGNIESGLEPAFLYDYTRNVVQRDGSKKPSQTTAFTARLWRHLNPGVDFPRHFITADKLPVHEHIAIQEACQNWIDASISKTINLPEETTYEDFVTVYDLAYEAGLKGCTTYRPSEVRGSILEGINESGHSNDHSLQLGGKGSAALNQRPALIGGYTVKVKWPGLNSAAYVTLNRLDDGSPFEIFLHSKDQRNNEWMTTSTLLMSWLMRMGVPLSTIAEELEQVHSIEGYFVEEKYRPSLVSLIGSKLRELDTAYKTGTEAPSTKTPLQPPLAPAPDNAGRNLNGGRRCTSCNSPSTILHEGCVKCLDCGHSKCS
jgi:ribonucleoside-diphosphate reductase alpha chain